jgi:hypothetical protein
MNEITQIDENMVMYPKFKSQRDFVIPLASLWLTMHTEGERV